MTSSSPAGAISKQRWSRSRTPIAWSSSPDYRVSARASSSASWQGGARNGRNVHLLQWDVGAPGVRIPRNPCPISRAGRRDAPGGSQGCRSLGAPGGDPLAAGAWKLIGYPDRRSPVDRQPTGGARASALDEAEPLLAGPETLFVTPVPSAPVRAAIERARERTSANPVNPRESADAASNILRNSGWTREGAQSRWAQRRHRPKQSRRSTRRLTRLSSSFATGALASRACTEMQ
jgi:hypothetical protein